MVVAILALASIAVLALVLVFTLVLALLAFHLVAFPAVINSARVHRDLALAETGQNVARFSYPQLQRVNAAPLVQE